jgi:hypothetical protein
LEPEALAIEELFFLVVEKTAERIPSFLLKRLLPHKKVREKIDIDLRSNSPIDCNFASQVPRVSLWFEITNRSSLNLEMDKCLLEVWFGQPTFIGSIHEPHLIPRAEKVSDIRYWQDLTEQQISQIKWCYDTVQANLTVHLTAFFRSKIGTIVVNKRVERNLK